MDEHNQKLSRLILAHPLFSDFEFKSLREIAHLINMTFFPRNKIQRNQQLSDVLALEITISGNAVPGRRELRIETPLGLTNPIVFNGGSLREVRELEPNNKKAFESYARNLKLSPKSNLQEGEPLILPVLINGQIMPGDTDRFRFKANEGEHLVVMAEARSLIPYLSDSVPGWFQATLTLYDSKGNRLKYIDDYQFNPDPVCFYNITDSGEYELEIRDSIYRGREDFIYRISIGDLPFMTHLYPLGGRYGKQMKVTVAGWNISETRVKLDTKSQSGLNYFAGNHLASKPLNQLTYHVNTLPSIKEKKYRKKQKIKIPSMLEGKIAFPGDKSSFYLDGKKGTQMVLEVFARRLGSPLDSIVYMKDNEGNIIAKNDDFVLKDGFLHKDITGLVTHHADSYLMTTLPEDGRYQIILEDSKKHGGENYGYRLRVSEKMPDFDVRFSPSSINIRRGGIVPITIHVLRKDGFTGPIQVDLKDMEGFTLQGGTIPEQCHQIQMTLAAPVSQVSKTFELNLISEAKISNNLITHLATPSDDVMQAFLFRHLIPAKKGMVKILDKKNRMPRFELTSETPIILSPGTKKAILIYAKKHKFTEDIRLELKNPPRGIQVSSIHPYNQGFSFQVSADEQVVQGFRTNLIVKAVREWVPSQNKKQKKRTTEIYLPALPIIIQ